ncbi:MAG: peptide ABC transporter substrate-binding protein [Planctomycetota bacterium]
MIKLLAPVIVLAALVAAVTLTDEPVPEADFTFINRGDVKTLDPQRMSWLQDLRIARLLYEPLVRLDVLHEDYPPIPGVARHWSVSDDGRTYTFFLRDDAAWSNGEPVTADHFVYAWRRGMLPDLGADYQTFFLLVEGAGDWAAWRSAATTRFAAESPGLAAPERRRRAEALWRETLERFDESVAMRAVGDRTLEITLEVPTPYFLDICGFISLCPVYEPVVSRYERVDPTTGLLKQELGWTKPGVCVTNGPFRLAKWRFKREMFFEKNEHWWAADTVALDTIAVPSIEDPNAAVLAFETGSVDWVSDVTVDYRIELARKKRELYEEHAGLVAELRATGKDVFAIDAALPDDPRKNFHVLPTFGTYWYNFNCQPRLPDGRANPFHDARVRRAFAMTVDKRSLVDEVLRVGNPVARTIVPPGSVAGYDAPRGLGCVSDAETDAEREAIVACARGLLADAGYADPGSFPTVDILFNKDAGHDLTAQAIAKNWQEHLGVSVTLAVKEIKVYADDLKNSNFMISRAGWFGDYADPTTFLDLNATGNGNNDRKYSSPEYDGLLAQAAAEPDPARRLDILEEAERLAVETDLPLIPLYHYVTPYLFDPDVVTGINPHPRATQDLYLVDILTDTKGPNRLLEIRSGDDYEKGLLPAASAGVAAARERSE